MNTPGLAHSDREALPPALPGERFRITSTVGEIEVYGPRSSRPGDARPLLLMHSVNAAASAHEVRPIFVRESRRRPTYALDLPGYGLSERAERLYDPRVMTDAIHAVTEAVRTRHRGVAIDALAVSLTCEMLARAATERADAYRSLALVSPTALEGRARRDGAPGSTRGMPAVRSVITTRALDDVLFGGLTRPGVIRFFLQKTFGRRDIDEDLWAYAVRTARAPGAKHAPLSFLSGHLFSGDANRVYESLRLPVWVCHGTRGDFVEYDGVDAMVAEHGWRVTVLETGAMPYFEQLDAFTSAYEAFLAQVGSPPPSMP